MKTSTLEQQDLKEDKIEMVAQQPAKEHKLVNRLRLQKGQKVWTVDILTREVKEAEYEAIAHFDGGVKSKIIMKPDTFYVCAINKQNALRKYEKAMGYA